MANDDLLRLQAETELALLALQGRTKAEPAQPAPADLLRNTGAWADPREEAMPESQIAALAYQQERSAPRADGFEQSAGNLGSQFASGVTSTVAAVPEQNSIMGAILQGRRIEDLSEREQTLLQEVEDLNALIQSTPPDDPRQEGWKRALQGNLDDLGWLDRMGEAEGDLIPAQDRAGFGLGQDLRALGEETFGKPDPRDDTFWGQVAHGMGTTVGIMAGTAVGGPGVGALQGSALNASQSYQEAIAAGASEETAQQAAMFGSVIGAAEVIPVMRAFNRLPASLRGQVGDRFVQTLVNIAKEGGEEAAQEYAQTVANNLVAQGLYDPERGWNEDAAESALVGAVSGGGATAVLESAGHLAQGLEPAEPPAPNRPMRPLPESLKIGDKNVRAALTQEDLASPLPTIEIAEGKAEFERIAPPGGNDAAFSGLDPDATPETPAADALAQVAEQTAAMVQTPVLDVPERPVFQDGTPARGEEDGEVLIEMDDASGEPVPTGRRFRYNAATDTLELLAETPHGADTREQQATPDGGASLLYEGRDQPAGGPQGGDTQRGGEASLPGAGGAVRQAEVASGGEAAGAVPPRILPGQPSGDLTPEGVQAKIEQDRRDYTLQGVARGVEALRAASPGKEVSLKVGRDPVTGKTRVTPIIETLPNGATVAREEDGKFASPQDPKFSVPVSQAKRLDMETAIPDDDDFRGAVQNTGGATITPDGLELDLVRFQKAEQAGQESVRSGVFYLPKGSPVYRHYNRPTAPQGGEAWYGGKDRVEGRTLIRRPLFVKGATGGVAPERAYDTLKGKGAFKAMRQDVLDMVVGRRDKVTADEVAAVLSRHGADPAMATSLVSHGRVGNRLAVGVQENIIAHAARAAGYDAIVGHNTSKGKPVISEVFDLREANYPDPAREGEDVALTPEFAAKDPLTKAVEALTKVAEAMQASAEAQAAAFRLSGQQEVTANPLRQGTERLEEFGLSEEHRAARRHGGKLPYVTREVARFLAKRQREKTGLIPRDDFSAGTIEKLADWAAMEVMAEVEAAASDPLEAERSAVGWYSDKYQRALDALGGLFPEFLGEVDTSLPGVAKLGTRENARAFFTALAAVTSDGNRVRDNYKMAARTYRDFRQTGVLTGDHIYGRRTGDIQESVAVIGQLLDGYGPEGMTQFLLQEETVKELVRQARIRGEKFDPGYLADAVLPHSALVFGPKLGAFYANLMGVEGYLTMDMWFMRTINRYRGDLIPSAPRQGIERVKRLIAEDRGDPTFLQATDEEVAAAVIPYQQAYKARGYKNGTEVEAAANTLWKAFYLDLNEAPTTGAERDFLIKIGKRTQELVNEEIASRGLGKPMTVADIQAVLWYYEKRLYTEVGARETDDISFEEAAQEIARDGLSARAGEGRGPRRARDQVAGEARDQAGDAQDADGEASANPVAELDPLEEAIRFRETGGFEDVGNGIAGDLVPGRVRFQLTDDVVMRSNALQEALRREATRLNLQGVNLATVGKLFGRSRDAEDWRQINGVYLNGAIVVALDTDVGPLTTFRHEAIHFLRDPKLWGRPHGLFNKMEWDLAVKAAWADPEVRAQVEGLYGTQSGETQNEEAVALLFEKWDAGNTDARGFVRDALQKIKKFLTALRNALRGQGFQTAEDVLRRVEEGVVGARGVERINEQEQQDPRAQERSGAAGAGGAAGVRGQGQGQGAGDAGTEPGTRPGLGAADDPVTADDLQRLRDPSVPLEVVEDFLRRPGWAIVTATREDLPASIKDRRNKEENAALKAKLDREGVPYLPVSGMYQGEFQGTSFLVLMGEAEALTLGKRLLQESILTNRGLVFSYRPLPTSPATGGVMVGDRALAEDFYSVTEDGIAFSLGLDLSIGPGKPVIPEGYHEDPERPQLPVRPDGMVELFHWSDKDLDVVDPAFAGTGPLQGVERRWGGKRSFWGINPRQDLREPGTGYVKESGLGDKEYVALVPADRLYPWWEDPLHLRTPGMSNTDYEKAIQTAGYLGSYVTDDGDVRNPRTLMGNVATLFYPVPVRRAEDPLRFRHMGPGPITGGTLAMPNLTVHQALRQAHMGFWGRLKSAVPGAWDEVRVKLQDRFLPVLRAQQAIERIYGKLDDDLNAYQREELFSSRAGDKLERLDREVIEPIIALISKTDGLTPDMVGKWLRARHAPERNRRIAQINPKMPDGGAGITTAEARAVMASMAQYRPVLDQIAAKIDKLRDDMIDFRVDMGLITADHGRTLKGMYRHYVPLQGFADAGGEPELDMTGVGNRFNIKGKEIQAAMGRSSEAFNPLVAMLVQAQEVIIRGEKNRVGQAVLALAEQFPSPHLWEVKKATTTRYVSKTTGLVVTKAVPAINPFQSPNELAVKRDGEEYRITLHDPRLVRALGNVGADRIHPIIQMIGAFTRFLSMMNTTLDPEFVIRNASRDFTAAQLNLRSNAMTQAGGARIAKKVRKNWFRAFLGARGGMVGRDATVWQKHYQEYAKAGGKISFWTLDSPEAGLADFERRVRLARGNVAARFLKVSTSPRALLSHRDNAVLGWIERQNLAVDNAVRLATFVAAREEGMSVEQAASLAKNLTVNFNRRGEWGPWINSLFMFANASIQGLHTFTKFFLSKKGLMMAGGLVGVGFVTDLMNASLSDEDDDGALFYDKIPDWKNATNLTLMLGSGSDDALTIWMPYVYGLFPYMGQQLGKVYRGVKDPGDALADVLVASVGQVAPINGGDAISTLLPTVADPLYELARNRDWQDRPIMPEDPFGSDFSPDSQRYFPGVSVFARELAQGINRATGGDTVVPGAVDVSPETVDHLKDFLLGGMGRFGARTFDLGAKLLSGEATESRDWPVARALYHRVEDWIDRERYYEFRDMVKAAEFQAEAYRAERKPVPAETAQLASLADALKDTERQLRDLRARRDQVDASGRSLAERAGQRAVIQDRETQVFLRFNGMVQERVGVIAE